MTVTPAFALDTAKQLLEVIRIASGTVTSKTIEQQFVMQGLNQDHVTVEIIVFGSIKDLLLYRKRAATLVLSTRGVIMRVNPNHLTWFENLGIANEILASPADTDPTMLSFYEEYYFRLIGVDLLAMCTSLSDSEQAEIEQIVASNIAANR
jgi:hypothetical protein